MGSKILPAQGLLLQPRNLLLPCHSTRKLLGFPTDFSHRFSSSRVSLSSYGFVLGPIFAVPPRVSFTVRSEASSSEIGLEGGDGSSEIVQGSSETLVLSDDAGAEEKTPRKPRVKLGEIMGILNQRAVEVRDGERPIPDLRPGDVVEIKWQRAENRRRLAVYKGVVMARQNAGIHTTIRIRRFVAGVGVEIVFPIYSPKIKELKVIDQKKVRKAKLYYLREKLPRFYTVK
ncbi:hypothetical protein Dimus_008982 [Dionaea muscipula]